MPFEHKKLLCQYNYDPLDRLVACTPADQASARRFYLKEGLTTETQGSARCSIFQQGDQLLAQQHRDTAVKTTLLATDQQRSVLHVLNTQLHPLAYTPYGHRTPESGLLSLLGFNGERPDPVTGHYLLGKGYRAFNPVLMRFNSADYLSPFGKGGLNAYAYCVGDPVNRVDPTGHIPSPFSKLLGLLDDLRLRGTNKSLLTDAPSKRTLKNTDTGSISGIIKTAEHSLSRKTAGTTSMSPARQFVDDAVRDVADPQPFVARLGAVNRNLASHGDTELPMAHAQNYKRLIDEVTHGQRSNTGAHFESAKMWAEKYRQDGSPSSLVGVFFNGFGGTLLSGTHDAALRKTGKSLRIAP
ncbi:MULTISPECIES: RHS repeat-associated core domain-containing protein [Pseudomonas]|uniref:RHS repeat-associated core domain-containing protein n=1 Tax=Pseudomonas TaxID=286 RepID=UPI001BE8D008|nr:MULTISPECIES: RHS repeat-associated core domain-containing protein [Pseudomonas]MBT2340996.1 RHS repeat-associated core domain-containing protein [Pseudomonas fluorescens]MCD4532470.1 RHS repeat-associated core domain-containing protein [Pseudomonas sp. C3-2018]